MRSFVWRELSTFGLKEEGAARNYPSLAFMLPVAALLVAGF